MNFRCLGGGKNSVSGKREGDLYYFSYVFLFMPQKQLLITEKSTIHNLPAYDEVSMCKYMSQIVVHVNECSVRVKIEALNHTIFRICAIC